MVILSLVAQPTTRPTATSRRAILKRCFIDVLLKSRLFDVSRRSPFGGSRSDLTVARPAITRPASGARGSPSRVPPPEECAISLFPHNSGHHRHGLAPPL